MLRAREALTQRFGRTVPDAVIDEVFRNGDADIGRDYVDTIREVAVGYAAEIMRRLREHEYDPQTMRLWIVGGGGCLLRHFGEACENTGSYTDLRGDLSLINSVEFVDQNPIGKSSRSNAATYLKAFDEIRRLFAEQQGAKQMGFDAGYFSYNAEGGRCEECKGEGTITIEMQFMADITLQCESCHGKRYKPEVLAIEYRGKNIYDILNMTINQAIEFFSESKGTTETRIVKRLLPLQQVGLGYVKMGQSSSTLSGGENQRIKLAYFLSQEKQRPSMFIFDEPTTGLHFHDINTLMASFNRLIEKGHTIIIIEHNLDVVKCADHVIDMGPEGGNGGGHIVCAGTPEDIAACPDSYTGRFLKDYNIVLTGIK